jgi:RNA polymerase sigma-70 factor, ECF subfamily
MSSIDDFNHHCPLLFLIAYRMLGTVSDAEDMVQETFLRWQQTANETVRSAKTYLSTIITRLCIDHLRSARVQREQYVGTLENTNRERDYVSKESVNRLPNP